MPDFQTRLRAIGPEDAKPFVSWLQRDTSDIDHSNPLHLEGVAHLIEAGTLRGAVIEYRGNRAEAWSIGAFACSLFVTVEYADDLKAHPCPWAFVRLLRDEIKEKATAVLTHEAVAAGNASHGLDLVFHYMQRCWDLSDPLWWAVAERAHDYLREHCGYRLVRVFQEGWERAPDLYEAAGYRKLATFVVPQSVSPGFSNADRPGVRALYFADVAHVKLLAPGATISKLLQFREPKCGFSLVEQKILMAAGRGLTDALIMDELGMSREGVKRAWGRIYGRVAARVPHVLDHLAEAESTKRGREKRRLVLKYLERHPEELRPRARPRRGSKNGAAGSPPGKAR